MSKKIALELSETEDSVLDLLGHWNFGWMMVLTVRRKTRRKWKRRTEATLTVWRKTNMKRKRIP